MKLSEIREAFEELSGKASAVNRQLALAGIGIIWIFRIAGDQNIYIPENFYCPTLFLLSSLGIDVLQYLVQSWTWYIFYHFKKWKKKRAGDVNSEKEYETNEPECLNYIPWLLFTVKVICMLVAYILLFLALRELFMPPMV